MGYKHIDNLYKHPEFLEEHVNEQVYALEKIHGTSAHIALKGDNKHLAKQDISHFVRTLQADIEREAGAQIVLDDEKCALMRKLMGRLVYEYISTR